LGRLGAAQGRAEKGVCWGTAQLIKFDCFREIKIAGNSITTGSTDRMQCNGYPEAGGLKWKVIYLTQN